jgi:exodeoxyribonuclease V alpha subunit
VDELDAETQFQFIQVNNPDECAEMVIAAYKKQLEYKDKVCGVQILSPLYKGKHGVHSLNALCQDLNPEQHMETVGDKKFKVGDKVMQTTNDYENNIFNGNIGIVQGFSYRTHHSHSADPNNPEIEVEVMFDESVNHIYYGKEAISQLQLAYAKTIHKSQGNEDKVVIIALMSAWHSFLNRKLLYTGLTRGKEHVIVIGQLEEAYEKAVLNDGPKRCTLLQHHIQVQVEEVQVEHDTGE